MLPHYEKVQICLPLLPGMIPATLLKSLPLLVSAARTPRSPIEKSLFVAFSHQGWEESSPRVGLGIAVSGGTGGDGQGSPRLRPGVLEPCGGVQTCGKAESRLSPAGRGQVAARIRVRLATVAVR